MKLKTTLITLLAISACVLFAFSTNKAARSSGLRGLQEVTMDTSNPAAPSFRLHNVNQLVQALLAVSAYSNSTFDTITINSFSKVDSENDTVYEAQLAIENDQGVSINALVTGNFDKDTNTINFSASEYQVAEGGNSTDASSDASDASDESDSDNNSTAPVYNITWPEGYVALSADEVANNEQANAALQFGINALIQTGINKYQIPAASPQYNLTTFMGAAYKNAHYGVNYKFATNLTNELDYKVDANITIYYLKATQSFMLAGYSFKSHGYPKSALPPAPTDNNNNNNNNNATNSSSNSTIPDNSTVIIPDNTTVVDNSTMPDNSTIPNNSTVGVPDNSTVIPPNNGTNSTKPSSNVTSDGYTVYNQWAKDSTARKALRFGVDSLVNWMISAKKIPAANPHYNITEVVWAGLKKQVVGTYYKFTVKTVNANYVHLNANVTVFYRYSTKKLNLAGYVYNAFNFSKSDIGKNNTQPVVSNPNPANDTSSPITDPVAPVDNSTVIADPAPVVVDNSTVVDAVPAASNDNPTVVDNGDAVVAGN